MVFPFLPCGVDGEVSADGKAEGLHGFYLFPLLTLVPHFDERLLHDVFRFFSVESDAKSQPEEYVFQGQYVVSETDMLYHLSVLIDDYGDGKVTV